LKQVDLIEATQMELNNPHFGVSQRWLADKSRFANNHEDIKKN